MEINLENPIFALYINVGETSKQKAHENLATFRNSINYDNITTWIIPVRNQESKIECIYPGKLFDISVFDKLKEIQNNINIYFKEHKDIPNDAHSFEVFSIKNNEDSPTGKQAFIGFKNKNNDFHFIGVPFTEPIKLNFAQKIYKKCKSLLNSF